MNMDGKDFKIKHLQEKPAIAEVRNIVTHVVEMVLPEQALRRYVSFNQKNNQLIAAKKKYNLNSFERIIVVGGGKAAKRTGAELVQILGYKITAGVLNVYRDQAEEPISERITEKCRCENNGDCPDLRRGLIVDGNSGRRNQYRRLPGYQQVVNDSAGYD